MRAPMFFAWGGYTTVGAGFAVRSVGSPNWTGAYNGVGDATLTWGAGEGVDVTQSGICAWGRTATSYVNLVAQTDTTLNLLAQDDAGAPIEAAVDFLIIAG